MRGAREHRRWVRDQKLLGADDFTRGLAELMFEAIGD